MSDYKYRVSIRSTQDENNEELILYEGNDESRAIQAEIAGTTLFNHRKSNTPVHLMVEAPAESRLKNPEYTKEVFMAIESKIINSVLRSFQEINADITVDDIKSIDYLKDDQKIPARLVFHYAANDDDETIISIENSGDILTSDADTYAIIDMNSGDKYHRYSFDRDDGKREVYITQDIKKIWNLMEERGYGNKYISFVTCSDPMEVQLFTGLEIDDDEECEDDE